MNNRLLLFIILFTGFTGILSAQNFAVQRGHFDDDIYVYGWRNLYHDANNPVDFYHISNYGTHLELQYSIPYPVVSSDLNLRNFTADQTQGLLFCTSVNEYETPIYKSIDYGKTWELLETEFPYSMPPIALLGGIVSGEVIMTVRLNSSTYGMAFTNDYFASQHLKQTYYWYFTKPETGNVQGEVFGIKNDYSSNLDFIFHTTDYGLNVTTIAIDSSVVFNANGIQALKICHGALPGEVYLITTNPPVVDTLPYVYKIFKSIDNGEKFEYKSTFSFGNSDVFTDFTGGREEGSFYVVNWHYRSDFQKQVLQIFYSADNASSFQLNEHLLDEFVKNENPESSVFSLFPNPATNFTTISGTHLRVIDEIVVNDISGRQVPVSKNLKTDKNIEIDCSNLENGLYLISLKSSEKVVKTLKLIVRH